MGRPSTRDISAAAPPSSEVGYVYVLCDAEERALYVGQSVNPARRLKQHRAAKPWFRRDVEWVKVFADQHRAIDSVEFHLIQSLQPRHNRQCTFTPEPVTSALLKLAEHLGVNHEWLRRNENGGMWIGEFGNLLSCEHTDFMRLCDSPHCEDRAANAVLRALECDADRAQSIRRRVGVD